VELALPTASSVVRTSFWLAVQGASGMVGASNLGSVGIGTHAYKRAGGGGGGGGGCGEGGGTGMARGARVPRARAASTRRAAARRRRRRVCEPLMDQRQLVHPSSLALALVS
jgi:hypothetical protein